MAKGLRRLAILLEREVPRFPRPRRELEQYRTPPEAALRLVGAFSGAACRTVVDLGSGTGMIAYAASLLLNIYVVGVEVDAEALRAARSSGLYKVTVVDFVQGDAASPPLRRTDCVAMNPPFGVVRRGMDMRFLRAAARLGARMVSSLHLASSGIEFIEKVLKGLGYGLETVWEESFPIPQLYPRHRRRIHYTRVYGILAVKEETRGGSKDGL